MGDKKISLIIVEYKEQKKMCTNKIIDFPTNFYSKPKLGPTKLYVQNRTSRKCFPNSALFASVFKVCAQVVKFFFVCYNYYYLSTTFRRDSCYENVILQIYNVFTDFCAEKNVYFKV